MIDAKQLKSMSDEDVEFFLLGMEEVDRKRVSEIEALKEYSIWLSDLAYKYHRMRNKTLSIEYKGDYDKVRDEVLMKFPIIQGFKNKQDIQEIGELKTDLDQSKMRMAVDFLLGRI